MSKRRDFIERTAIGVLNFFKDSVFADEVALRPGFLQRRGSQVKLVCALLSLAAVLFLKNIYFISGVYLAVIILAVISKIELWFFFKRTWIFIPLFSLFIAIPALFSVISPGEPLFVFGVIGLKFIVTRQGLDAAILFVARVATCVSITVLLALVTRHNELLKGLRAFGVLQIFVLTMGMCYRYIYLFAEIIENTFLAIKSRVGFVARGHRGRRLVVWNMGSLWQRSYQLHKQVYSAMLSRGWQGEPKVYKVYKEKAE